LQQKLPLAACPQARGGLLRAFLIQVCFAALCFADVLAEAEAAAAAGWHTVLVTREGNKPIPDGHPFRIVSSMSELVDL